MKRSETNGEAPDSMQKMLQIKDISTIQTDFGAFIVIKTSSGLDQTVDNKQLIQIIWSTTSLYLGMWLLMDGPICKENSTTLEPVGFVS